MAGAPANSKWRKVENVYYPEDLQKVPEATLEEVVPALTVAKQPPPTQALLPPPEATKKPSKASDQGSGVEVAKGKEVG